MITLLSIILIFYVGISLTIAGNQYSKWFDSEASKITSPPRPIEFIKYGFSWPMRLL